MKYLYIVVPIFLLQLYECIQVDNNNNNINKTVVPMKVAQDRNFTTVVIPYTSVESISTSLSFSSIMNSTAASPSCTMATSTLPASTITQTVTKVDQVTHVEKVTQTVIVSEEDQIDKRMKSCYRKNRKVTFTQYWIPIENEWDESNDGKRVFLGGDVKKTKLLDPNKKEIASVSEIMYNKCKMEGTCLLDSGDLINIDNSTQSFIKVGGKGRDKNVFGLGSGPQNLVPYISIAANDIPNGQKLYISQLDGLDVGNGMRHNGCVRVDDDSWSFDSCQLDWFVLSYVDYLWLDLEDTVSIRYADDCKLKNYINKHHLAFVKATPNEKVIPSLLEAKYKK